MADKPRLVETAPSLKYVEPDAAKIFKEALRLRKPLEPTIRKVTEVTAVVIGKPPPDRWFMVNGSPEANYDCYLIKDGDRNYYYVADTMIDHELIYRRRKPVRLVEAALWPPGSIYIIPFHHPDAGKDIKAYSSAWKGYEQALTEWTQLVWSSDHFDAPRAENNPNKPVFSGKTMDELLVIGFPGRVIDSPDHPYVRERLRGDATG